MRRCSSSVDANAAGDENRRFFNNNVTKSEVPLAPLARVSSRRNFEYLVSAACTSTSVLGYATSRGSTTRFANRRLPSAFTMSSLSRRTIADARVSGLGVIPRAKRCGSRSSNNAVNDSVYPLCGVADKNRRCSKCGDSSRIAVVR